MPNTWPTGHARSGGGSAWSPADVQATTRLLARLNDSRRILDSAQLRLTAAAARGADVGPAGDWLLDNFHVVQEHVREVHESLPRDYYRELPELANGSLAGYPRVYELATTPSAHRGSHRPGQRGAVRGRLPGERAALDRRTWPCRRCSGWD